MKIKITAILLLLVMTGIVISCAQTDNPAENTTAADGITQPENTPETQTTAPEPDLPDKDFEGYEFKIMNRIYGYSCYNFEYQVVEREDGSLINDAVYRRNLTVEEMYNVKISEIIVTDIANDVKKSILAGDQAFDLAFVRSEHIAPIVAPGMLIDFKTIPYIDMEKPWWDQNARRDLSVLNKQFWMNSDIGISHYDTAIIMFFNKKIAADYNLPDFYQLVRDGKWTYDVFSQSIKDLPIDIDGNGTFDKNDFWPMAGWHSITYTQWFHSGGQKIVTKDSNDSLVFNAATQAFSDQFYKVKEVLANCKIPGADKNADHLAMFNNDLLMFFSATTGEAKEFRDMESDFGIIPAPKPSEAQESYYVYSNYPVSMIVPATTADIERTGILIEALSYEGYKTVIPNYYQIMIQTKYIRDTDTIDMLDNYINNNLMYDIGNDIIRTIGEPITKLLMDDKDLTSYIASAESSVEGMLSDFLSQIE